MQQIVGAPTGSYSFSASGKTVAISGFPALEPEHVTYIFNVTRGVKIYAVEDGSPMGTWNGLQVTLTYDTTSHADTDSLMVVVESPNALTVQFANDGILLEIRDQLLKANEWLEALAEILT